MELPLANGIVTLLTDFGLDDPYVGIVKGMILRAHKNASIVDLGHGVPAQAVQVGAFFLAAALDRFPVGTVHLAVVDPGVGTARRVLAAAAGRCYWIGPDNGILSSVLDRDADGEVRAVDLGRVGLEPGSATFHGRDVFAPLAGRLSSGKYGYRALGPRIDDPVRLPALTEGGPRVIHVDRFGNLITNLRAAGAEVVKIAGQRIPVRSHYAEVADGELIAVVNSYDLLEISARNASAAAALGVGSGVPVEAGGA